MGIEWKKRDFERACRWGSDAEIREQARKLKDTSPSFNREEIAEFISETLEKEKHFETRKFGSEVSYDGITIRKGLFPFIKIEESEEEY